jgi:hypothetical protein
MAPGDRGDFRARLLWVISEIEKRANVTQFETNFTSVTNEGQTPNVGLAILASPIGASARRGQQPFGLIEPAGRDFQLGLTRDDADSGHGA